MPAAESVISSKPSDRIIVALDVDSPEAARELIDELGDSVGAFKVGLQLFTTAGPNFVRELTRTGRRIFLDLKYHDIPSTVVKAGIEAAKIGVWMFNIHALGGSEMMRRTGDSVAEFCERERIQRPKIVAVTILTSSGANELREIGIEKDVAKEVVSLAQLTAQCGLDGVVASSFEANAIKKAAGISFLVVTPGVRPASETFDDQKRVNTPATAIKAGADFLVIGRPITQATDRHRAAAEIADQISFISEPIPE